MNPRSVWKFPFHTTDNVVIEMPKGAQVLSIQTQHGKPCMWALVDPEAPKVNRLFRVFGTGHPIPFFEENLSYDGTYQEQGGDLVWHVFTAVK